MILDRILQMEENVQSIREEVRGLIAWVAVPKAVKTLANNQFKVCQLPSDYKTACSDFTSNAANLIAKILMDNQ